MESRFFFCFLSQVSLYKCVLLNGVIFITIIRLSRFLLGTQQVTRPHGIYVAHKRPDSYTCTFNPK